MFSLARFRRAIVAAVTCVSCGAKFGQPHTSTCKFETIALLAAHQ